MTLRTILLARPALRRIPAVAASLAVLAGLAAAQTTTFKGSLRYRDLDWDLGGHDGTTTLRPSRYSSVQLIDTTTGNVVATDETASNGSFTLSATTVLGRTYAVRAVAQSISRNVVVRDGTTLSLPTVVGPLWSSEKPIGTAPFASSVKLKAIVLGVMNDPTGGGRVGNPWNILDQAIDALDFLVTLESSLAAPTLGYTLEMHWPSPTGGTSYATFDSQDVVIGNDDGYDDTIIQHELGHVVHGNFSTNQSPGGSHSLCGTNQDERLSWSEGFATFWGSNVLRWRGDPDPGIYVESTGLYEEDNLNFSYRLEDATGPGPTSLCSTAVFGRQSELAVQCGLWDLTDLPADDPTNPTADDDPMDGSVLPGGVAPMQAVWNVFTDYMHFAPTGGVVGGVMDTWDFWDGWWALGYLDVASERDAFVDALTPWFERRIELTLSLIAPDVYNTAAAAFGNAPPGATLEVRGWPGTTYPAQLVHDRRLRVVPAPGSQASVVLGP